jgi:methyl-accepting chemotaxis protein
MKILYFSKENLKEKWQAIKNFKTPVTLEILLLSFIISVFPIFILSSYLIRSIHSGEDDKAQLFSSQVMALVNSELEIVLEQQASILDLVGGQYSVFIEKNLLSSTEFSQKLESLADSKPYIESAYVKTTEEAPLYYFAKEVNPKFEKFDIMIDYLYKESSYSKTSIISEPHKDRGIQQTVITLCTPLMSSQNTYLGTLFIDISMDKLSTHLTQYIYSLGMPDYVNTLVYLDGGPIVATTLPYEQNHLRDFSGGATILNEQSTSFTHTLNETEYIFFRGERKNGLNIISYLSTEHLRQSVATQLKPIMILLFIVVSISLFVAIIYTYLFVRPLHRMTKVIGYIKNKDLTHTIDTNQIRIKEFFTIGIAINDLSSHLSETLGAFQNTSHTLLNSWENVSSHIAHTYKTYEETTAITAHMHEGSTYQNNQLEGIRHTSSNVKEQLDNLTLLQEATSINSSQMKQFAQDGNASLFKLKQSIASTTQTLKGVSDQVKRLLSHLVEIESMSRSISDIAKKTNLLALNASIEASRGSSHGGFTVIAKEVQSLADASSHFSKQIAQVAKATTINIEELVAEVEQTEFTQNATTQDVSYTERSFSLISEAISLVDANMKKMQHHFSTIILANSTMFSQIETVATTAKENYAHATHINDSTNKQVAMLQEIRSATSLLGGMANELRELHQEYKL